MDELRGNDAPNLSPPPGGSTPPPPPPPSPPPPPPPLTPPPFAQSAPPPRRGGRGWKILSLVLFVFLAFSLLANGVCLLRALFGGMGSIGPHRGQLVLRESVLQDHGSPNKIAVLGVSGVIMGSYIDGQSYNMVRLIKGQLKAAAQDPAVKAVILRLNSPGGEVLAADEISRALTKFQDDTHKPVVASMGGVAASGAYYIAAPCRWIVANPLTITGSIGVIMHGYNYRGLLDKVGIVPEVFKSGKFKDMLSPDKAPNEILPESRQMIQTLITQAYDRFKQVVQDGRTNAQRLNDGTGRSLIPNWQKLADGRILSGTQAYQDGFVDELGDFNAAVRRAEKLAGIPTANLIQYQVPFDLSDLLQRFAKTEAPSLKLKLDLGVEGPKLELGHMYYLFVPGI